MTDPLDLTYRIIGRNGLFQCYYDYIAAGGGKHCLEQRNVNIRILAGADYINECNLPCIWVVIDLCHIHIVDGRQQFKFTFDQSGRSIVRNIVCRLSVKLQGECAVSGTVLDMLYLRAGFDAVGHSYYLSSTVTEYLSFDESIVVYRDVGIECLDQCIDIVGQIRLIRLIDQAVGVIVDSVGKKFFRSGIMRTGVDKDIVSLTAGNCVASNATIEDIIERCSDQPVVSGTRDKGQGDLVCLLYAIRIVGQTELRGIQRIVALLAVYGHAVAFITETLDDKDAVK